MSRIRHRVNRGPVCPQRREDPPSSGRGGGGSQFDGAVATQGQRAYTQYCAACHGANQRSAIAGIPPLVGVTDRVDQESFRVIVSDGRNNMRPIVDASNEDIRAIYTYLQATNPAGFGGGGRGRGGGAAGAVRRCHPAVVGAEARRARPCRRATAAVLSRRRRHGRQHAVAR